MAGLGVVSFYSSPMLVRIYESTCNYKQEDNNMELHYRGTPKYFSVLYSSAYSGIISP
jgi:hypothetical protein